MYSNEDDPDLIDKKKRSQYDRTIASLADGSRFAEYTIIKLLGRGGMGAVYEARHEILEKHFAVKALPYEFMTRKDAVERFRTEARVMANLRHPNIVQVDDFRETNGLYWLRMELARGDGDGVRSLQELAKKTDGIIEQELLLTLMLDVLKGIAYGHQKGLVHRDLKPANILLFPKQGGGLTAKVSDYGLVKMFGEEFLRSRVTQSVQLSLAGVGPRSIGDEVTQGNQQGGTSTRALLGTWEYMSPEQKRGEEATPASDVYSLGLMCFQLLTGEELSLRLPHQLNSKIVTEWDNILLKALESRPENRFSDAVEMLQALEMVCQAIQELTEQKRREKIEAEIREIRQKAATAVQDGDLNDALKMLMKASEKYPEQKQLHDDMSAIRKQIKEREATQKRYQEGLQQADQLISANQLDKALELLTGLTSQFPDKPELSVNIADLKAKIEKRDEKEKKYQESLKQVDWLVSANRLDEALEVLTGLVSQYQDKSELHEKIADLKEEIAKRDEARKRYQEGLQRADQLISANQLDNALGLLTGLTSQFPDKPELSDKIADLKKKIAKREDAERRRKEAEQHRLEEEQKRQEIEQKHREAEQKRREAEQKRLEEERKRREIEQKRLEEEQKRQEEERLARERSRRRLLMVGGIGGVIIVLIIIVGVFSRGGGGPMWQKTDPFPTPVSDPFANPYHQKEVTVDLGGGVRLAMVYLQSGSFQMGSPDSESGRDDDEGPVHRVELDGFWIGKYEVTQAQYRAIMGTNPSEFKGDNRPVEMVSWNDAMEFCRKLSEKTGKRFTLPTEARWEYACRAGARTRYCFGDDSDLLREYAWYSNNSNGETHPVGQKKPNAWGLYDMHGNVWEWCLDWYDSDYYRNSSSSNPKGPSSGSNRVLRGGGWLIYPGGCRSAIRSRLSPGLRPANLGFRLAAP